MDIKEIRDKSVWEDFLMNCQEKTFLQSWNWGEFCLEMGEKIWRWGIYGNEQGAASNEQLIAVALVEKKTAKRGTFLLVPHGPAFAKASAGKAAMILVVLTNKLKELGKEEKVAFIRINSILEKNEANAQVFKKLGFRNAPLQIHPEASWKLNLEPSEEELFANMRKTTRYLIRQAQKNDKISFSQSNDFKDVEIFSRFHDQVSKRQSFIPFSLEYLQKEFSAFDKDGGVSLFFGYHNKEIACGSFVVFWSGIGFYHHAISVPKFAKLSIPYLLLWEAIKKAKKRGCKIYDFWGFVDPKKQPSHPWAGPTLFKMGFGGKAHEYIKTQDLALSRKYWLTYVFEKIRKLKRQL